MGVLFYLLLAVALYVIYRTWQGVYRLFREYFVLWNVAVGARQDRRNVSAKVRLHAYVCQTDLLDEVSMNELYRFLMTMLDTTATIDQFHTVILSYKYAITCRERKDGSLRGVSFLDIRPQEVDGQRYTLIRLGLSFFENFYRGGPLLYYIVSYHIFKQLMRHPLTPIYVIGKAFSYKSYMGFAHSVKEFFPRYNAPTPPFIKNIIDSYAESVKTADEEYDRESCVLKRELSSIKASVAPISPADLKDPHIRFFTEQNPGWHRGHQLIMVAKVTWFDLLRVIFKAIGRNRNGWGKSRQDQDKVDSRQKSSLKSPPLKYARQFTFQCETTSRFATAFSEMDIGGHHEEREARTQTFASQASFDVYDHMQL